ncbi:MAG: ATP synthase F1 subunit delta [Elusimicrobia bacterium]|nr:ATP synthase F1 subunit delta [Elusimicrobiota bacterium]
MKKNNPKKFAKILFQLATETKQVEKIKTSLKSLNPLYSEEIMLFFSNPFIDRDKKKDLIKEFYPELPVLLLNFLYILIDESILQLLPRIEKRFNDLYLQSKNTVIAKIISVDILEKPVLEKIRKIIEQYTNKHVLIETKQDKSIIGGIVAKTDDLLIDGSIKGKLNSFKTQMETL